MDYSVMAHLLHGINASLEKRAAEMEDLLSSPDSLRDATSKARKLDKFKDFFSNPYLRSAMPGAAAGLGAGILGSSLGDNSWYSPAITAALGGLGGAGIQGAINKGLISQKYAPMVQGLYPAAMGGAILGNAISDDHPILGTLGGAALGGGAKIGIDALIKRFGGMKR